ncbi:MAG: cobalamin B12-binding domain-containing protein [Chloroflexota bacterium]
MSAKRIIRVLIAKPGLDGHDRGSRVVAEGLRDEGMEVIYTGIRQTPEMIVEAAVQEDVDVVGLSCLAGTHKYHAPRVVELLKEKSSRPVLVIVGGIIPEEDIPFLKEKGIAAVFGPGTLLKTIADYIRKNVSD